MKEAVASFVAVRSTVPRGERDRCKAAVNLSADHIGRERLDSVGLARCDRRAVEPVAASMARGAALAVALRVAVERLSPICARMAAVPSPVLAAAGVRAEVVEAPMLLAALAALGAAEGP